MGSNFGKAINNSTLGINGLLVIGFLGIVWLMIYGNLEGNLGFTGGSAGDNNTQGVIDNITGGVSTFFGFSNVLFTIIAIVLLITLLLALLSIVMDIVKTTSGKKGGFSG